MMDRNVDQNGGPKCVPKWWTEMVDRNVDRNMDRNVDRNVDRNGGLKFYEGNLFIFDVWDRNFGTLFGMLFGTLWRTFWDGLLEHFLEHFWGHFLGHFLGRFSGHFLAHFLNTASCCCGGSFELGTKVVLEELCKMGTVNNLLNVL